MAAVMYFLIVFTCLAHLVQHDADWKISIGVVSPKLAKATI